MATGPEWVRREISGILAENYKRFGEDPEGEEPAEMEKAGAAWPGAEPAQMANA
jgi:hypothetical protein